MKHSIWMCAGLALAAAQAGIVEETHSKPELAASVEIAPFTEIRQKLVGLGTLVKNPIVPMALVPAIQSAIAENMGELRPDAAITVRTYVYQPAWQIAVTSDVEYAVEDLMKTEVAYADSPKAPRPLVRAEITATGLSALEDYLGQTDEEGKRERAAMGDEISGLDLWLRLCDENRDPATEVDLRAYARSRLLVDLDPRGLSFDFCLEPRPGGKASPAAGFRLPAGALDGVPDGAPFALAVNDMLTGLCKDEKEWKASNESSARVAEGLLRHALKSKKVQKYAPVLNGVVAAWTAELRAAEFPDPADWSVCALAFGTNREPYFVSGGVVVAARRQDASDIRFLDALAAAVEKQWPGRGLVHASAGRLTIDYAAVLDVAAAESHVKGADRELARAKSRLGRILGATKGELAVVPQAGTAHAAVYGPAGFRRPASQKPTGEARFAAILPETVADRPSCAGWLSSYALARDFALPAAVEFVPKRHRSLYQAILRSLPPAGQSSAIAGAYWSRSDGSHRLLLRVTADELKNYGAVYNVYSAARLSPRGN